MRHRRCSLLGAAVLTLAFLGLGAPESLEAQRPRDFLFGKPRVTLTLNMGYGLPRAGSDIFQEVDTLLTLGKGDFRSPVFGGSVAVFLSERMDLALDVSYSGSESWSEYQDWLEDLGGGVEVPIEQKTTFRRIPVTASLRYYFLDRGREVSRFAWVPNKWSPYLGAGGGRVFYRFEQEGDFVDFLDYSIFGSRFESSGSSWTTHVLGGLQFAASTHAVVTMEGRYSWADAELDRNMFSGYEPIDLSGFQATLGIGVRF